MSLFFSLFVLSITGTDEIPHDHGIVRALNAHYKINRRVVGDPRHTVFIGRLHVKTEENTIKQKFCKYGKVIRCRVVRDLVTGNSKQYAFLEFESSESVRNAVRNMNKEYIDGCEIIVDYEHERLMKHWKPRRLGGGFGGRRESGQLRFGGRDRPFQRPFDSGHTLTNSDMKQIFRTQKSKK